ncbi:MAG: serine/threonine protein kinase [Sedimentisphaerales bacterium]|nr:serine/threonine protein kinase [Sedimentisphaerales bacterium]
MPELTRLKTHRLSLSEAETPVFEGYEVIRRLGVGAGSVIYYVKKEGTDQGFALKHVIRQNGQDKRMIVQVENEFRMAKMVNHPYVRNVIEIRRIKKRLQTREVYMLMEFCPGISLEQSPSRSVLDLLLIFRMVADGINGMHNSGLLHCDMKPNNIIIAEDGSIRIIDLGQSCFIGTIKPRIQGTPDYIAPEQVKRKPLSKQTDVFNLGATLYWAFTGRHVPTLIPKKTDRVELAEASTVGPPPTPHQLKPKIPLGVSNLIMDCVAKEPKDRPADMLALISRLDLLIHMIAGGKPTANGGS